MNCKQQSVLQMFIPSKDFSLEIGLYQYMNKMKWLGFGLGSFVTDLEYFLGSFACSQMKVETVATWLKKSLKKVEKHGNALQTQPATRLNTSAAGMKPTEASKNFRW